MRILCADGIAHTDAKGKRSAVYSVDIQPNEGRLATASGGTFYSPQFRLSTGGLTVVLAAPSPQL